MIRVPWWRSLLEGDGAEALDKLSSIHIAGQLAGHDGTLLERKVHNGSSAVAVEGK